jgi:zinc transporter ZupT
MTDANAILNAFFLSLLAGLGSLKAVICKLGKRVFGLLMEITAGVMSTLSFHEMVKEAWELQGFVTATVLLSALFLEQYLCFSYQDFLGYDLSKGLTTTIYHDHDSR